MTAVLTVKSGLDPHLISGIGMVWLGMDGLDWIGYSSTSLGLFGWTSHSK